MTDLFGLLPQTISISNFFFRAFATVFAVIYLIYSIVILRQTRVMIRSVMEEEMVNNVILLISRLQLILALALLASTFLL
ncbi:MAG: DUF5657 family protein [Patescibacteria group bacterium]